MLTTSHATDPAEQVVICSSETKFELCDGKPGLVRLTELNLNDDKYGKPVGITTDASREYVYWTKVQYAGLLCLDRKI